MGFSSCQFQSGRSGAQSLQLIEATTPPQSARLPIGQLYERFQAFNKPLRFLLLMAGNNQQIFSSEAGADVELQFRWGPQLPGQAPFQMKLTGLPHVD